MKKPKAVWRYALEAARPIVAECLDMEITSYALPEDSKRAGSVHGGGSYYYHPDTVKDVDAARTIRQCKRALRLIDAAASHT